MLMFVKKKGRRVKFGSDWEVIFKNRVYKRRIKEDLKNEGRFFFLFPRVRHLLSSLSQLVTLPFQSQVCLSKSKANPLGHVIGFRPDFVHLKGEKAGA